MDVPVTALVGVYDADGTLWGELGYWVGARLGRRHCSLCELTHGTFRVRADWLECRSDLPVAFETYHRNDQPADVRAIAAGEYPVVVARTTSGVQVLLGPAELDACSGNLDQFVVALEAAVARMGLTLP
ncbi:MAG: hypothetical protein ACKOYM_04920 [Actinomycetes bacterium]